MVRVPALPRAEGEQRCPVLVAEPVNEDSSCAKRFAGRLDGRLNEPHHAPRGRSARRDFEEATVKICVLIPHIQASLES
jgi:hypothetical protein